VSRAQNELFPSVKTEGALLPPDVLGRITASKPDLDGLKPDQYHLAKGEKLNEAINRSWNRLLSLWPGYRSALADLLENEAATGVTRDRWLLPLFQELGFGRLQRSKAITLHNRAYPISHLWGASAVHLVGARISLDKRTAGQAGAAKSSPHSLIQEFLNRSDDHLWAFVSNGLVLRVLRDNLSLVRQAYVEFDLEAMMEGEIYSDFRLLWLLCHQSRVEGDRPEECWLEQWTKLGREQGARVLEHLRDGVQNAIEILGSGFLSHPDNSALRQRLTDGELGTQDLYRQLLRLIYRLIFLFVAEDRGLLFNPGSSLESKERYNDHYSTHRLRQLARKLRGSRHADLFESLKVVMGCLHQDGNAALGLPALGSFLWTPDGVEDLNGCSIRNRVLLDAIRALGFSQQDHSLRPIDYRNLGSEELGSVYESLLELHPELHIEAGTFDLGSAAGHERKTTGSYYTHASLIGALLKSALDPVLEVAAGKKDPEQAILNLKVCDPAVGSGHFLVAAAYRIARKLASVRTGDEEPAPTELEHAVRDVVGHCLYGVDVNEMAVELCKFSLWLAAMEPGKPLSFLDNRIRLGNSLLGTTPALLEKGIPDDAFKPIEGDDKEVVKNLKKRNKNERGGQRDLFGVVEGDLSIYNDLIAMTKSVEKERGDTIESLRAKEQDYADLRGSTEYQHTRMIADAWCAAFLWKKTSSSLPGVTNDLFYEIKEEPQRVGDSIKIEIKRLAKQYQLFHWHLEFPDVFQQPEQSKKAENEQMGWDGGFDVVLGNPPWDQLQIDPREFFAIAAPELAVAETTAKRNRHISKLKSENPLLFAQWCEEVRRLEGIQSFIHFSGRSPLGSVGRLNSAPLFTELSLCLVNRNGRIGIVVPSGIATDSFCRHLFSQMVESKALVSLFDFENREGLFPDVDKRLKFSLLTCGNPLTPVNRVASFAFFAHQVGDLKIPDRRFSLTSSDISLLNPNTNTCSIFRTTRDALVTRDIYRRVPILRRDIDNGDSDPWGFVSRLLLMSNTRSELFERLEDLQQRGFNATGPVLGNGSDIYLPLYEAKMFQIYDHRASDVIVSKKALKRQAQPSKISSDAHQNPERFPQPRFWVNASAGNDSFGNYLRGWYLAVTKVTSATNARTFVAAILPRFPSTDSSFAMLLTSDAATAAASACFCGNVCSFVFDYVARQKLGGVNMLSFIQKQLPVLPPATYAKTWPWRSDSKPGIAIEKFLLSRVVELTYTAWDLEAFALDCGYSGPPFRWNEERRFLLQCELDAAYFHLYLGSSSEWGTDSSQLFEVFPTPRDAVDYIMETFLIVKRKDIARTEEKDASGTTTTEGHYITKEAILEIYDEMAEAIDAGKPYQTRLDPPPADPSVAHPPR
jgi:hypothetical protein